MFSLFSCGSDDAPDYSQMEASGEILVNGEIMPFNEKSTIARGDENVLILQIDASASGYSFMLQFTERSGDITDSCIGAGIAGFDSADTYIYSGSVIVEKYVPNEYIKIKFDNVEFRDEKNIHISKRLSLKGGITFPVRKN